MDVSSGSHKPARWQLYSWVLLLLLSASGGALAQQDYAGNNQLACTPGGNPSRSVAVGYACSTAQPACQTLAYYRTQQSQTLQEVATLFATTPSALANANSLSSSASLSPNQPLLIPLSCNCSSLQYSDADVPHTIQQDDTMSKLGNSTYEGLASCDGIQTSNPSVNPSDMALGSSLIIPIRCACPSAAQLSSGIKLLLTYAVAPQDNPYNISVAFGVNESLLLEANNLPAEPVIYPQTTLLIPLASKPGTAPGTGASTPSSSSGSSRSVHASKDVSIGIAACVVAVLLLVLDASLLGAEPMQESALASSAGLQHEIAIAARCSRSNDEISRTGSYQGLGLEGGCSSLMG